MPEDVTQAPDTVLVVDLDGTLSRSDTLHEALMRLLSTRPLAVPGLLKQALTGDKPGFKRRVADHVILEPGELIFDPVVLAAIEQARADGRKVALVSASDDRVVQAVSDHLGVFDEAFGTGAEAVTGNLDGGNLGGSNLGGRGKADFLTARYGARGFDYIGDCRTDLPVWQAANRAYSANPAPSLQAAATAAGITLEQLHPAPSGFARLKPYLKSLRPHQWSKNVLVFLPMLAAQDYAAFWAACLAFVLFSLMASSVYILNDLLDLSADRAHPRKCRRPFAAADIPISHGIVMTTGLIGLSLVVSLLLLPGVFTVVLLGYFLVTLAYSFVLKRKLIVDVITLAGLYTVRIIAGGAAVSILPSPWLLAFSVFLFYALAAVKRQGELIDQARAGQEARPGRAYLASDVTVMQIMSISAGQGAVMIFALYIYSPAVAELYTHPEILWLICPVLLYWLSRIAILTHRGHMDDDPIVFAAKDKISFVTVATVVLILLAAEYAVLL